MANITATAAGIGTAGDTTLGPVGVAYEMAVIIIDFFKPANIKQNQC